MAKKYFKKALSMTLALTLCLSLTAPAFAEEGEEKTDVNGAFDQVVGEIKTEFIDPDATNATNLNNGVTTADANAVETTAKEANDAAKALGDNLNGTVGKVTEQEFEMVEKPVLDEEGNPVLDEEGNPVTELVPQAKGDATVNEQKTLDTFMGEKATTAAEAAEAGKTAVEEADKAMENLEQLVANGNTQAVQGIANAVKEQAEAADQAYQEAAKAHAQAEAALNAAKEQYNAVIDNALKAAVEAGKVTEDELKDMTDEEKAAKAIELANGDLTAARTALNTAKQTLLDLEDTRNAAANAKTIADKYSDIATKLADAKTNDDVVTILLGLEDWKVENKDILASLDKKGIDNNGLADTAVDYALADKAVKDAEAALNELENNETAKSVDPLIQEINNALKDLYNAYNHDTHRDWEGKINQIKTYMAQLTQAHQNLRDPNADHQAAKDKLDEAVKILFDGYKKNSVSYVDSLTKQLYKENFTRSDAKEARDRAYNSLIKLLEADKTIRESGYDASVSIATQGVTNAQDALDQINLDAALNAYLDTIGAENGANAADAATKAAQLAAVLRGISDKAVEDAQAKAAKAAQAAQTAANNLATAQEAYDTALSKLNGINVNGAVTGVGMQKLFDEANQALIDAKAALDAAKDKKDEADQKKDEADKAVDDAEENRRRIDELTGGDDLDDTGVTIGDQVIPLSSGPVTRAQFIDYLWRHEGSPAAEGELFADHEYAPAIAWALSFELIDETFQPDELVTVADVRAILGSFAQVFGTNAVSVADLTTLTGGDGEAVMNCDQVLAEFFGEEYLLPEDLDSLETDDAA